MDGLRLLTCIFGRLNLEQMYSLEDPLLSVASTNPLSKYVMPSDISESDNRAREGSASSCDGSHSDYYGSIF
jgi:hypothetical protein